MAKGSGTTKAGVAGNPRGISGGKYIDLSEVYKHSGMLDMDFSKAPKIKESDFTEEDQYYRMTKPMELDVKVAKVEDFWNRGLTGGESGQQMRAAKREIADSIKKFSGEEISLSAIEWDKNNNEFTVWHKVKKPGDVSKSFWKITGMKQTVRFMKEKRTGYLTAADKYGEPLHTHYATHNYTVKVTNTGVKEY